MGGDAMRWQTRCERVEMNEQRTMAHGEWRFHAFQTSQSDSQKTRPRSSIR